MAKAEAGFENFLKWQERVGLQVRASEIYLRSMKHHFGGIDCVGLVNDRLSIVDWKSAADPYPNQLVQIRTYGVLWEENFPDVAAIISSVSARKTQRPIITIGRNCLAPSKRFSVFPNFTDSTGD